jgi:hypothetical protein
MKQGKKSKLTPAQKKVQKALKRASKAQLPKAEKISFTGKTGVYGKKAGGRAGIKTTKKMIGKAGKTISKKDMKIATGKKAGGRTGVKKLMGGGRSGPVKMMKGGDPLSPRGVKMGMGMSPSKNKGKGLYGK